MTQRPELRYAKDGDFYTAYEVFGDGPRDLVVNLGQGLPFEAAWEEPTFTELLLRLADFNRVIRFDRAGVGLSDPTSPTDPYTIEQSSPNFIAVLNEVGSDRAAVLGLDTSASQVSLVCAATHPDRVSSLILVHPSARIRKSADYPWGRTHEEMAARGPLDPSTEARIRHARALVPSQAGDARFEDWFLRSVRRGVSPGMLAALSVTWAGIDLRPLLPAVRAPTLVIKRSECDWQVDLKERCLNVVELIPDARYVEIPGADAVGYTEDIGPLLEEVEEFLIGTRTVQVPDDRVFATVLFTDFVGSTAHTVQVGDRRWRELLDDHDAAVERELERFRGRLVKTTGDGVLATFDGPARAVRCAQSISQTVSGLGLDMRAGLHAGEVELRGEDLTGIAVNIARRVCDEGGAGDVLVSRTIVDLVAGADLRFGDRGERELKGVPGTWQLYEVVS